MSRINSKAKGSRFELDIVAFFKKLGWDCSTSRFSSRELDDAKVDIFGVSPLNVQCKAVERLSESYHDVLASMPKDTNYNVLFHKRNRKGVTVTMTLDDFEDILKQLIVAGAVKPVGSGDAIDFLAETGICLEGESSG